MQSEVRMADDVAIVKAPNKFLDAFTSKAFRGEVMKLCEGGQRNFILDLSDIDFIDSAGIGVIILLYKTIGSEGSLLLCGVKERVDAALSLVSLKPLIPICKSVDEALKKIHQSN